MKFKKNADGAIILDENDIETLTAEITTSVASKVAATMPPPAPPVAPDKTAQDGEKADPKSFQPATEFERSPEKNARLAKALVAISGGKLAVEDAPKEIKTIRYFQALGRKDMAVVKALGHGSWPRGTVNLDGKALTEGSATDGGNLVPIEFATDLIVAIETYSAIQDCTQHTMTTNEKDLRSVTTKPLVYQVDELVAPTEAAPKFGKPQLIAKAFAGLQVISKEEFNDNNVGLYDKLLALFAEAFQARMSNELFVGTSFTGIFGSTTPQTITLAGTTVDSITYANLVAMTTAITEGQLKGGGKFYMHRQTWGAILGITDDNHRPIVQDPWSPKNRSLLGFPVTLDEQIKTSVTGAVNADTGVIAFGNLMWVDFGMRQQIEAQLLTEGTVATINLAEKRGYGLMLDTRWGTLVTMPSYLVQAKTKA